MSKNIAKSYAYRIIFLLLGVAYCSAVFADLKKELEELSETKDNIRKKELIAEIINSPDLSDISSYGLTLSQF